MLNLFTEEFNFLGKVKFLVKKILKKENRGPRAVFLSLVRGLRELKTSFSVNENFTDTVVVLSGILPLKKAILKKQQGVIKKLIAGPNLVVLPSEYGSIIANKEIDRVIMPSLWVKEYYEKLEPRLIGKISVWPAGVKVPQNEEQKEKTLDFIVYNKVGMSEIFKDVVHFLNFRKYVFKVVDYNNFKQAEFFHLLNSTKALIYLSESESQGLAMFEAWARNVPVLIWERGFWEKQGFRVSGNTASPYVSEQSGMRFKNFADFKDVLPNFLKSNFEPKRYVLENFTDSLCAEKLLEIIKNA